MKSELIKVCDKLSSGDEITMQEYNVIDNYLRKCNQGKSGNTDDVVSEFVLDVKMNYDKTKELKQKEARLYAHIKRAIQKIAIFDTVGTLNNPAPICLDGIDIEDWGSPANVSWNTLDELIGIDELLTTSLEKDIYECCIKGKTPVAYIAKEYGKSAEWGRIVKDKILLKIRNRIENMPQ